MFEVKSLIVEHKKKRLVDLSFKIDNSLALVGASGSGKSLTLKALIGMLPRDFRAHLDIKSPFELKRGKSVAFIPQNPFTALSPMTKISKQWFNDEKRAKELFKLVGLSWELFNRYPPELSGGQLQRVIFAMALATNPKLLLLDEPTTALDANLRDDIASLLVNLQSNLGFKMLFVTHDINLASKICEDTLVIKDGKEVEQGKSAIVLSSPKESYTKLLIDANFSNREFRK